MNVYVECSEFRDKRATLNPAVCRATVPPWRLVHDEYQAKDELS